jgi:glutamine amidotransferase
MTISVEIVSSGFSNVGSVVSAFSTVRNVRVRVIGNARESENPNLMVLPGNGSFGSTSSKLVESELWELILRRHESFQPILGICLGMQLLGDSSEEARTGRGLGIIPGSSKRLNKSLVTPHIGWEQVEWQRQLTGETLPGGDYFFMHSYEFVPNNENAILATSEVGHGTVVSAVMSNSTIGVQFHPEKSSLIGMELLERVCGWANEQN